MQDKLNEKTDADIIWMYDMRDELGVFPHNVTSSSAIVVGDIVYVATSNGVDWSHTNIPAPLSPSWIALDKNTGELIGEDGSGASQCVARRLVFADFRKSRRQGNAFLGGTDGFCYGYPNKTEKDADGYDLFNPTWKVDCNEPHYRKDKNGKKIPYATPPGPSELIGTPVLYKEKIYCAIGQDPEHGDGVGRLTCIDAKTGKVVWKNTDIGRTISTISVADDLVYLAEYAGIIHCLDANTGKVYWTYDSFSRIWGSTLVVDGRFSWVTKTETSWSWIMARTNPRSNWLAWGLPSTVHRFLQTERCTSRPRPTCTPSASDDERLRVFNRQKFSLASLRLDVSWPPRFLVVGRQYPHSGFLPIGLAYHAPFRSDAPCLVGSPLARHGPVN